MSFKRLGVLFGVLLFVAAPLVAANDIPLRDWSVPSASGGVSALGDIGNPSAFVAVTPCRLVDTRVGFGFSGAYGPPAITSAARTINVVASGCTGIPSGVTAFSLNFTVTNTSGPGFIMAYAAGGTQPSVSTLNYLAGQTLANAAIVPAGSGTSIAVLAGVSSTDLIIDINGYFTNSPNLNKQLYINGSFNNAAAIVGLNGSSVAGSHGVGGYAGGTGVVHGVQGQISSAAAAGSSAVHGIGANTGRITFGVLGQSSSAANDGAGVIGKMLAPTVLPASTNLISAAGVRGEGDSRGVVGVAGATGWGVTGLSVSSTGSLQQFGRLGVGTTYGVYANGNMGASGTKTFVEPHPTDASKVIKFVSLEGPEAGTYFRGTASSEGGVYVIDVPESFRMVSAEEGLTVQLTTVGSPARAWVVSESLDQIVVRTSADTKFHYLVQGVRKAYRDFQPIVPGDEFMPQSPKDMLPLWLSEDGRQRLISNGTYNADGTVNMETAERAGWAQRWREAEQVR